MVDDRIELIVSASGDRLVWQRGSRQAQITEDDAYVLALAAPDAWGTPALFIQDYQLDDPAMVERGEVAHWEWPTQAYFRNSFGLTTLRVEFRNGPVLDSEPIEVLARRLQASEAMRMLEYIYERSPSLLHACFSRTGVGAAWGPDAPTVQRIVSVAEDCLTAVEALLFAPFHRVRTRLRENRQLKQYRPTDILDDRSIAYLLSNLDRGSAAPRRDALPVGLPGRRIYFDQVDVVEKTEATNVYENGVIHGLLWSVGVRLRAVEKHLQLVAKQIHSYVGQRAVGVETEDYQKFQTVCGYYVSRIASQPQQQITDLIARLTVCRRRAEKTIPAQRVLTVPRQTPWFSTFPRYRAIFVQARRWYQMGDSIADATQFLSRLRTMDRLYEYACLFKLLEFFTTEGWALTASYRLGGSEPTIEPINNVYQLHHSTIGTLDLRYEPSIRSQGTGDALWGLEKIAGKRKLAYQPDFVFRVTTADGIVWRGLFDAKYSTQSSIDRYHLSQLVLKYAHGITLQGQPQEHPFQHIWAMGPRLRPYTNFHWQDEAAGLSRTSLGTIQVFPDDGDEGMHYWYRNVFLTALRNARRV